MGLGNPEKEALNVMSTIKERLEHLDKLIESTHSGVLLLGEKLQIVVEPLTGRSLPPIPKDSVETDPEMETPEKRPDLRDILRKLNNQIIDLELVQREIQNLKAYEEDFKRVVYGSGEAVEIGSGETVETESEPVYQE